MRKHRPQGRALDLVGPSLLGRLLERLLYRPSPPPGRYRIWRQPREHEHHVHLEWTLIADLPADAQENIRRHLPPREER